MSIHAEPRGQAPHPQRGMAREPSRGSGFPIGRPLDVRLLVAAGSAQDIGRHQGAFRRINRAIRVKRAIKWLAVLTAIAWIIAMVVSERVGPAL